MPIKTDMYSHLTEVFNRMMLHHPTDAYEKFEEISALVKQTNFKIRDPRQDFDVNKQAGAVTNQEMLDFIDKFLNLLKETPDLVSAADRNLVSDKLDCQIPCYPQQAEMLEWAGIGFGEDRNFLIQKSLKRLARISKATRVEFFGKILCSNQDYWVAWGNLPNQESGPKNPLQESRGKGMNEIVFWVTHNLVNDWVQLPDVQPEHIIKARGMKKMLTGNLNFKIAYPLQERHILRA